MTFSRLSEMAKAVIATIQKRLPKEIRPLAQNLPVLFEAQPTEGALMEGCEPDVLGLFVGNPYGADTGDNNALPPQILLFLENIWDYAEQDRETYREEVRLTYLHELGHYFGWDETDLEIRGLD